MKILQVTEKEYSEVMAAMMATDNRPLAKKLGEQGNDQDFNSGYEPLLDDGQDEPDLDTALWATFSSWDLLTAPTGIGYGSGEELWEALQSEQSFSQQEADELMRLLSKIKPLQGDDDDNEQTE